MRKSVGVGAVSGVWEGRMDERAGVGLGEGLSGHGAASGDGVSSEVAGSSGVSGGSDGGVTGHKGGGGSIRGHGCGVTGQLLSKHWGDTGGGTVELRLGGPHGIYGLPRVVFGGVNGLSGDLGCLVVEFASGVTGGAGMVGGLDVTVDHGTLDVSGRDGGQSGDGVGDGNGGGMGDGQGRGYSVVCSHSVGCGVTNEAVAIGCCQQGAGRRGCGAGEDGGGDNLKTQIPIQSSSQTSPGSNSSNNPKFVSRH